METTVAKKIETKEFTVREVFDALKQNGFEHIRSMWQDTHNGSLTGGCILGQGAANLGVLPGNDEDLSLITEDYFTNQLGLEYPEYNDDEEYYSREEVIDSAAAFSLEKQLNRFENTGKWAKDSNNPFANLSKCANAIMHWNDAIDPNSIKVRDRYGNLVNQYLLKTYDEVVEAAREILEPHMDKTVTLAIVDYSQWLPPKK